MGPRSTWSTTVPSRPDGATACEYRIAGRWPVRGPVKMQQHQHSGRFAQVMDPRDGFLAAVAALVQVYCACRSSPPRAGSSARRCRPRAAGAARPPDVPRRPTPRPAARPPRSTGPASRRPARVARRRSSSMPGELIRRTKPPSGSATAVSSAGSESTPRAPSTVSSASRGPSSDNTARSAGSIATSDQNTILRR